MRSGGSADAGTDLAQLRDATWTVVSGLARRLWYQAGLVSWPSRLEAATRNESPIRLYMSGEVRQLTAARARVVEQEDRDLGPAGGRARVDEPLRR